MNPLSVSGSCITLIQTIVKVSLLTTRFVLDVRAARTEIDATSRELLSLKTVLELLAEDVAEPYAKSFPEALRQQIIGIVINCNGVVEEIETTLAKHERLKISKAAHWVASGKNDIAKLRACLEAYRSALDIALDMANLVITKDIKDETHHIRIEVRETRDQASAIKEDTAQILIEVARLQEQLPQDVNRFHQSGFMLEKYLDNLTSYAESVCDSFLEDFESSASRSTVCLVKYSQLSHDRWETDRPLRRRFVKIPCPGRDCGEKEEDWTCYVCGSPIEFGYSNEYIYCDCGRSLYYDYEFKCSSKVHGPGFSRYDSKALLLLLRNLPKPAGLNILVLGETGVGKSTFINAFINYLSFHTLDGAMKAEELNYLIPCSFSTQIMDRSNPDLDIQEFKVAIGASEDERDGSHGQSATLRTVVHPVNIGTDIIRLIDTPGLGDTRGVEHDRKNIADILSVLSRYDELHGILILLRSNVPRLTLQFRYVVKELLSHFHRDAMKNLAFGFTNTRVSNYTPGDAFRPLSSLLEQLDNIPLRVSTPTTYCFDSESFRFLAAHKMGIYMGNLQDFMRSWEHSRAEAMRLVGHFRSQPPHRVQSTMTLNSTRDLLPRLAKSMVEIMQVINASITLKSELDQDNLNDQLRTIQSRFREDLIAEYTSEHDQIQQASVLLGLFIHQHSTTVYNDETLAYMDSQISDERRKVTAGQSRWVLDVLLKDRAEQAELIQTLTDMCDSTNKSTAESVSEERVRQILAQLCNLKHFGHSLNKFINPILAPVASRSTETPYRVKSGHSRTWDSLHGLSFPSRAEFISNTWMRE